MVVEKAIKMGRGPSRPIPTAMGRLGVAEVRAKGQGVRVVETAPQAVVARLLRASANPIT